MCYIARFVSCNSALGSGRSGPAMTGEKICVLCNQDVSGKPRTKDRQGRYACRACLDKRAATMPATEIAAPPDHAEDAIAMSDEGGGWSLENELVAGPTGTPCPQCNGNMTSGAVLCTTCGYNAATGGLSSTRIEKEKRERHLPGGASVGGAIKTLDAVASSPAGILLAVVGAGVGALLGMGLYVLIAQQFDREIRLVALGCGLLSGVGALAVVRHNAGLMSGIIGALAAIVSVVGGRYAAYEYVIGAEADRVVQNVHATDDHAIGMLARDVSKEMAASGKNYQWPEGSDPAAAIAEEDFPSPVWTEAKKRYATFDDTTKAAKIAAAEEELTRVKQQFHREAVDASFNESFKEQVDVRTGRYVRRTTQMSFGLVFFGWIVMAGVAGFGVGSGGQFFNDD